MKTAATVEYLNHRIRIKLPEPDRGNRIEVVIENILEEPEGVYHYLTHFEFSVQSAPNDWIIEAMQQAIAKLEEYDIRFH